MRNKITCLFLIIFIASCGGGASQNSSQQTTTKVGETTVAEATISQTNGGVINLPEGEKLEIPAGALNEDLKITVKKEGQTYKFEPAGLIANQPLTFKIPVDATLKSQAIGKHVVGYLYSDQSLAVTTNSGKINADRLLMVDGDSLGTTQELSVPLKHFSIFRLSVQDRIYIPINLPTKYLQKGDIVFALSHENYQFCATCSDFYTITPESQFSFDWFPGHAAIIASPNDDLTCGDDSTLKDCNIVESTPPRVRVSNLSRDFISPTGHLFMGARRPKEFSITSSEMDSVSTWATSQAGKQWTFLNDKAVFTGDSYSAFSCVGLVEASYKRGIGKGIVNDSWRWLQDDGYVRPLDMFDKTKQVDAINVKAGEHVSFKVNAVFLSQDKKQYFDLRNKDKAGSDFQLSAAGLPTGATFNQETGDFSWDIPSTYENGSVKVTFSVRNSWPGGIISPAISETKYEYLTINIQKQAQPTPSLSINFDSASLTALGASESGGFVIVPGRTGSTTTAGKFQGIANPGYLRIPNRESMQFTDAASFDFFARIDSMTGMDGYGNTVTDGSFAMTLIAKSHDRVGASFMANSLTTATSGTWVASFDSSMSGGCEYVSHPITPLGNWVRVTYTMATNGGIYGYLDKNLAFKCPTAKPNFTTMNGQDLYIGKFSDYWYPLNGAIQDLRIYKKALTASEVQALQ